MSPLFRPACALAVLAATVLAAPAWGQADCPRGTTPTYNTATQSVTCIGNDDVCPPGQEPHFNTATETIVCIGGGDRSEAEGPEPLCPPGRAALRTEDGTLHCVDLSIPPIAYCAAPYRESRIHECVWTCAAGTQPDTASGECVCMPGHVETGTDRAGRRVCSIDTTATIPVPTDVPAQIPLEPVGPPQPPGPDPMPDATVR